MTIKELIEKLSEMDETRLVVLSRDEEGNGFDTLSKVEQVSFIKDGYDSYILFEELTEELIKYGYTEEDIDTDHKGVPALVLWP